MMQDHFQLNDLEFLKQFKNTSLGPELFTHEAHIRFAYLHIHEYGIDKAISNVSDQILNYATSLGAEHTFNKTVTIAAVKAVYHFMLKSEAEGFKGFITEFPRLKYNFKEILSQHYNIDIYNSDIAKSTFLEPDLIPFD